MIKEQSVDMFLEQLASRASTPGGGSVAAIMGAMGAALVSMVANLTVGKKHDEAVEAEMQHLLDRSETACAQLTDMIQQDVDVFNKVMAAYAMPKETAEETRTRTHAIQAALKGATDVPLACARLCADVIALCLPAAEKGNVNVISDAGVAVLAAQAALKSAALNVYINIGGIHDEDFTAERQRELDGILAQTGDLTEEVYDLVKSKLQK